MNGSADLLKRLALGAVGGLAGTFAIQALLSATQKWLPAAAPPIRQDPGEYMVERAEEALPAGVRDAVPEAIEKVAANALGLGYGVTFGALYAALRPEGGNVLRDGALLGLAAWAAGYLGWLPALGLMPPVWRQRPAQAAAPMAEHLAYGAVTVAAYDWLNERV